MGNLIDIQSQIAKLQSQANDIKVKEFKKTVVEIVATMQAFGITTADLQQAIGARRKSRVQAVATKKRGASRPATKVPVRAKYRGPNGETWSGRGLTPRWLSTLLSQGRTKEEFAVDS